VYTLTETQIQFILDDLRRRGIETEDLQLNLLDHICCIIEGELEANGDFGQFYSSVITRFYKRELMEVEEETQSLLLFKNYYTMKKIMMTSGTTAAAITALGILFKFMHFPGAAFLLLLGIVSFSLVFLPILLTLRIRERKEIKERIIVVTGVLAGMLLSLAVLFKIQHWPMANVMGFTSVLMFALLFLPLYFFTGIRNTANKENVIVNSLIIIMGCGLFLTLVRTNQAQERFQADRTRDYLQQAQLLAHERSLTNIDSAKVLVQEAKSINQLCEDLKKKIILFDTGMEINPGTADESKILLNESIANDFIGSGTEMSNEVDKLRSSLSEYNQKRSPGMTPLTNNLDSKELRTVAALEGLVRIQLSLLQNARVAN
jgi:hypothetical protein